MTARGFYSALVTCPWCPWREEIRRPTRDEVIEAGRLAADDHNGAAGHRVRSERRARIGYYRGKPIA